MLKKWANILISIQNQVEQVENKSIKSSEVFAKIIESFQLNELNNLPAFANEIRTQIGYSIRSLSIACWNKQSDIKSALSLINYALKIQVANDDLTKFKQDKAELEELEKKYKGILVCYFCEANAPDKGYEISKTIYKETSRTIFPRGVKFTYTEVKIPRCKSCAEIHSEGSNKHLFVILGGIALGVLIGAANDGHYIIGGIIGLIVGFIASSIITNKIDNPKIKTKGIKIDNESTLRNHPLIIERFRNGWTFDKPTAY